MPKWLRPPGSGGGRSRSPGPGWWRQPATAAAQLQERIRMPGRVDRPTSLVDERCWTAAKASVLRRVRARAGGRIAATRDVRDIGKPASCSPASPSWTAMHSASVGYAGDAAARRPTPAAFAPASGGSVGDVSMDAWCERSRGGNQAWLDPRADGGRNGGSLSRETNSPMPRGTSCGSGAGRIASERAGSAASAPPLTCLPAFTGSVRSGSPSTYTTSACSSPWR